jgi:hypothetical protein
MKTPQLPQSHFESGVRHVAPNDIQMMVHGAWLLAGIAIALAGCTVADEASLHDVPANPNTNVAHMQPAPNAQSGNVQDLTY